MNVLTSFRICLRRWGLTWWLSTINLVYLLMKIFKTVKLVLNVRQEKKWTKTKTVKLESRLGCTCLSLFNLDYGAISNKLQAQKKKHTHARTQPPPLHTLQVPSCFLLRCPLHRKPGHAAGFRIKPMRHKVVDLENMAQSWTLWGFYLLFVLISTHNSPLIVS